MGASHASGKMRVVRARDETTIARAVYDATASEYARLVGTSISATTETDDDRRLLLDVVRAAREPIADLGSGPGRVAALCEREGRPAVAVDMSMAMLRAGQAAHPHVRFAAAHLSSLPFSSGSFGAAVLWYSIIHAAPPQLAVVFGEVRRIVAPGAAVLVAFQSGGSEIHRRTDAYGTGMTMTSWRHDPAVVADALTSCGLEARDVRVRASELPHESTPQAFVVACAPA
jgi:ubiquinone/menaquinone biosynthesis C-methylase UbiE